jgi:hypothetical protein
MDEITIELGASQVRDGRFHRVCRAHRSHLCEIEGFDLRAVAAEHDWKFAALHDGANGISQLRGPSRDGVCIERERLWIAFGMVRRCRQPPGVASPNAFCQAEPEQRLGQLANAGRPEA